MSNKSAYCIPKRIICMLQKHGLHAMGAQCMCYRSYNLTVLQYYSYNLHPIEVAR